MRYKERLKDHGLKITGKAKVNLRDLHIRYIPMTFNENWVGHRPMALPVSPHVELMNIFFRHGFDIPRVQASRYFKDRQYRNSVGMNWPDKKILEHCKKRYKTFKEIRNHGFKKDKCKDTPIIVLNEPFWKSRYNSEAPFVEGLEVWNGAGRCAAAYAVGIKELPCIMIKDAKPGKCKSHLDKKLKGVKHD